jgi:hypothetical protein
MRKIKSVCLLAAMMMCTLFAKAQYTVTMDQYQLKNYSSVTYDISLSEICKALDVDTATFTADYLNWVENGGDVDYIELTSDDGSNTTQMKYTQGYNGGYWMTADGHAIDWSESSECTFCVLPWPDSESDVLSFSFYQIPNKAQVGDVLHCTLALSYNAHEVTFDFTINVIEKEASGVETSLSKLNILGTAETTVTEEPRTDYTPDVASVDLTAALEALGYDDIKKVSENLSDYLYMAWFNSDTEAKEDALRNQWTANSGFWTGTFYDEATGTETGELVENVTWKVYVENFKLDTGTKILTFNVGQQPNALKNSESYWLPMYLINGSNAYIIRLNLKTTEPDPEEVEVDFKDKTKVGEINLSMEQSPNNNYKATNVYFDADSICTLLGTDKSKVSFWAESAEGEPSNNSTQGSTGGYWIDKNGYVITWGDNSYATFSCNSTEWNGGYISSCQMPNKCSVGDTLTCRGYFMGPQTYVVVNLTINYVKYAGYDMSQYQMVDEQMLEFQVVPSDGEWNNDHMTEGITLTDLAEKLGEGSYTFLGDEKISDEKIIVSDNYTCDPAPAFWMDGSYTHVFTGTNSFGIIYTASTNQFTFVKQPNLNKVGESYQANFYLLNPATDKYIKYHLYLEYVDEIINYVNVGAEAIALPLNGDEGDYAETPVDMTKCYEALGCDAESFAENGIWKIQNAKGKFAADGYEDEMYGFWLDSEGNPTAEEEAKLYSAEFLSAAGSDCGQDCFRSNAFDKNTHVVRLAAEYDGNRYIFTLTLCEDPTGIQSIEDGNNTDATIHDLTGRKVTNPSEGIYIVGGKKYLIKK